MCACRPMPGFSLIFNHYETHAVTPHPRAPSVRKGLTQGPRGMSVGWDRPGGPGYICRVCATTVWGHARTEMIRMATMHIKSQTDWIYYLNLVTKGQPVCRQENKHSWKNIKCVCAGWYQLLTADWIIGARREKKLQLCCSLKHLPSFAYTRFSAQSIWASSQFKSSIVTTKPNHLESDHIF